jgi:Fe-Mn family superoxide dismutase
LAGGIEDPSEQKVIALGEKMYVLAPLPYEYGALAPVISEELLRLHHDKHHAAYVNGANNILSKLDKARKENADLDMKAIGKEFSFNFGGLFLHEKFWKNMAPTGKGGGKPGGKIGDAVIQEFGTFERFKKEFSQAATSCEGSGWAALTFCGHTDRVEVAQIEKHNVNVPPQQKILLVLDVWEHAYYLDYKNDRGKFVENWWNLVNWDEVDKRMP